MASLLSQRALLVRPSFSVWRGEITDRGASRETAERHGAVARQVKTTKFLIDQHVLDPIDSAVSYLRNHVVRRNTLPWRWDKVSLLPSDNYFAFMEEWREGKRMLEHEVGMLCKRWMQHVATGQRSLGTLAKEYEYPTAEEVRGKFGAYLEMFQVPDADDFRASINEAEAEEIRLQLQEANDAQFAEAQTYLWEQMQECVAHIVDRLSAYGRDDRGKVVGKFRDTLIGNLRDLVERLDRLNIARNPEIERMRRELLASLCPHDPDELRADETLRSSVRDEAKRIMDEMATLGYGQAA